MWCDEGEKSLAVGFRQGMDSAMQGGGL
jgi:hypothetical protein